MAQKKHAKLRGLGLDVIDIARFGRVSKSRANLFLKNNFTALELEYCFSYKDPRSHLAGIFAAKEAVFKSLNKTNILFSSIEILKSKKSGLEVRVNAKLQKNILVSISHTEKTAFAIAICQ